MFKYNIIVENTLLGGIILLILQKKKSWKIKRIILVQV